MFCCKGRQGPANGELLTTSYDYNRRPLQGKRPEQGWSVHPHHQREVGMTRTDVVASSRPQKADAAPIEERIVQRDAQALGVAGRFRSDDGARAADDGPCSGRAVRLQQQTDDDQHDTNTDDRNSPTPTTGPPRRKKAARRRKRRRLKRRQANRPRRLNRRRKRRLCRSRALTFAGRSAVACS